MLRPATEQDVEHLRVWRNHPAVRAVSLTRHEIGPEEHRSWWEKVQQDPTRQVLVFEFHGTAAGVVTFFDLAGTTGWWGYYLDNAGLEARGELLPAWIKIQREAVRWADDELGLTELHGEVLGVNEPVRRMNTRNGFTEVSSEVRDVAGEPVEVFHIVRTTSPQAAKESQ